MSETEDPIDALLRDQFEGPVAADGFSEAVMDRLPARRQRRNWPLAAGALAGIALCWNSLGSSSLIRSAGQDWLSGNLSGAALALLAVMAGGAVLALAWSIAEADDRAAPLSR